MSGESQTDVGAAKARPRAARRKIALASVLAAAAVVCAGGFIHARGQHVYANDARIASDVVALASEAAGRVVELKVRPGDAVRAGQVLVRLEPRDAEFALQEIEANIAALEAQKAQLRAQQAAITSRVGRAVEVSNAGVLQAEAGLAAAQADLKLARSAFSRTQTLHSKGLLARSRLEEDQARLTAAEKAVDRAKAAVDAARGDVYVTASGRDDADVLNEQIAALDAQRAGLLAKRAQHSLDLSRREIVAAFDGVIDQTFVDAGEFVTPGARILMYHNPRNVWVDANVKETEFRKLAVGAQATVKVDAYPGRKFKARVQRIGGAATSQFALLPNPNPSGNFTKVTQRLPVRLVLEGSNGFLRPGMMVEVNIDAVD
ncbi:MAG: HlyD family secretion protein [Phenylobacterium sp.]|uniref:HlyD family secretion protein n=1 Tax=Phenylobacterium sp. TaxID=1871053 RepID=UPI001A2B937F|nr:HlyD family secretion protein [Phenylobacterium sp.]MBJ7411952.1 HlyD family secretion protein [Phenylobacterium sp.]